MLNVSVTVLDNTSRRSRQPESIGFLFALFPGKISLLFAGCKGYVQVKTKSLWQFLELCQHPAIFASSQRQLTQFKERTMTNVLTFNDTALVPVLYNQQPWIRSAELSRALGYKREDKVSRIYQRHVEEFTPEMTQVIEISDTPTSGVAGNLVVKTRIFSLRGCHLLAMFSRTPVAKAFRVWVLDVLETLNKAEQLQKTQQLDTLSRFSIRTDPERKELTAMVNAWIGCAPIHYAGAWSIINAKFGTKSVDGLTVAQVKEAIKFVQGKINEQKAALATLPAPITPHAEITRLGNEMHLRLRQAGDIARDMNRIVHDMHSTVGLGRPGYTPERFALAELVGRGMETALNATDEAAEAAVRNAQAMCKVIRL